MSLDILPETSDSVKQTVEGRRVLKNLQKLLPNSLPASLTPPTTRDIAPVLDPTPGFVSFLVDPPRPQLPDGAVISKIEDMMEDMVDCLLGEKKQLVISLRSRANRDKVPLEVRASAVTFPGKTPKEAWKFTVLLRILECSHEALVSGSIMTKRDLYYRDPELFLNQSVVDRYVEDLAHTLGVDRKEMNIVAAAKGLVSGMAKLVMKDRSTVDCCVDGGVLIPPIGEVLYVLLPINFNWILIVEKEATFHSLSCSDVFNSVTGSGMLVTGKGYPDILTRQFVSCVAGLVANHGVDVFTLTDFDPDGIAIHLTYKYGSRAHKNRALTTPNVVHIGITSELHAAWIKEQGTGQHYTELRLSKRDRALVNGMLESTRLQGSGNRRTRQDLQRMLMLNMKAEIQILEERDLVDSVVSLIENFHDNKEDESE